MKFKFNVGEKVLCFEPDETKARVLYNAKIMDADVLKDNKGKKFVEYKIHFQGWNHAWDRWADESFVLKDDEQNRKLQRKLARRAIRKLKLQKGRKRHHLPGVASRPEGEEILQSDSGSDESIDSNISASTSTTKEKMSESEEYQVPNKKFAPSHITRPGFAQKAPDEDILSIRDEHHVRRALNLDIPQSLRRRLEDDYTMIKRRDMLVKLPITPNIVQILDNYVKKFAMQYINMVDKQKLASASSVQPADPEALIPPEKRLNLCHEVCCDVKLLFDYALPLVLLYSPEKEQYKHMICNTKVSRGESDANESEQLHAEEKNSVERSFLGETATGILGYREPVPHLTQDLANTGATSNTQQVMSQDPPKVSKKKNAEALMIEETHKYLIPNQPNLDQTGLSKDAQGRRRSSRLSHHDSSPPQKALVLDSLSPLNCEKTEGDLNRKLNIRCLYNVSAGPYIFLRAPTRPGRSSSSSSLNPESPIPSVGVVRPPLFNSNPRMDRETYIFSVGGDKNLAELKKAWEWSIIPVTYQPEDGASVPPSMVYGVHHLLRMFVKLPEILAKMEIPEFKIKVITKHLHSVLKFLSEYERELFEVDGYVPAHSLPVT